MHHNAITLTNYNESTGVGSLLRSKQKWLDEHYKGKREAMVLLIIKPTDASTYQNFVDVIYEVTINNVKTYVVMKPATTEFQYAFSH